MKSLQQLATTLQANRVDYGKFTKHWNNEAPASFLSKDSRAALDGKINSLGVNFPKLVVSSMVERMKLHSIKDSSGLEHGLGNVNIGQLSDKVHTLRALYGAAYVTTWVNDDGEPVARADSPLNAVSDIDPATGRVRAAARFWVDGSETFAAYFTHNWAYVFKQDTVTFPSGQWQQVSDLRHGLGVVPIVPFIRETGVGDATLGTSAVSDILDLSSANAKALGDAMVTSEYFAKPRRWATGLELQEDEDGNIIDPFGDDRFLQSEAPDTKFGQMTGSTPDGYVGLSGLLTQQIGALSGLPPHYLGLHGDQPASADAVRASEAQLISRVADEIRDVSPRWSEVAALLHGLEQGKPVDKPNNYVAVWGSPETKNPGQAADVAVKLSTIGVPLRELLAMVMDWSADEVDAAVDGAASEQVRRAALGG